MSNLARIRNAVRTSMRSQFTTSQSTDTTAGDRTRRVFWASLFLIKAVCCGLRSVQKECLGSEVFYRGKRCCVVNWANGDRPTISGQNFYVESVPRSEIKNVRSLREYSFRFAFGITSYLYNWYGVDVNQKVHHRKWKSSHSKVLQ